MDITINQLKKAYGSKVVLDIEQYTIHSREIIGLVGNNGAGKTTLFRLMLDLLKVDEGSVRIGEIEVSSSEQWKEITGAYLDESFLIDYLTPEEYFYFVGRMCNLNRQTVDERLAAYERFMNGEVLGQKKLIRNLSAGNKQKVGILAALLNNPKLIILDEPFNFLDPSSQSALKQLLVTYNQSTGATILVSSHNLNHTIDISTRIALLEHGKLIRDIDNTDGSASSELETYFAI
ncbi:ABC transporter ATP-binding protein [Phocaeicola sp.]|uniref:ABC transporter ATP-binding protein n=1 Tax=Phocaeicola sp. TaxID=2773926 RepID=UPI003AB6A77A